MVELKSEDFGRLIPLFKDKPYGRCRALGVLEGALPERSFSDDLDNPRVALVKNLTVSCFVAGQPGDEVLSDQIKKVLYEDFGEFSLRAGTPALHDWVQSF